MTKPGWLKTKPPSGAKFIGLKKIIEEFKLNTVCTGARCPNMGECWGRGTATFMILGSVCTRNCRFCAVKKGKAGEPLDPSEPARIAQAVEKMGLKYVVLTSVDRDDLADGGAGHFASCIKAIKSPGDNIGDNIMVEALIPDFHGDEASLQKITDAHPDVVGHNIETVEELQALARDRRASYNLSLEVLRKTKQMSSSIYVKSSIMLGLGETEEMVLKTMADLRNAGVDIITLGQYLRPSEKQLEVKEYISPGKFDDYKKKAENMGFLSVQSGPLVRSSYMADISVSVKNKKV
ncbi:MAG: lipoyl synthase [Candidatus Methanoperedens sp.]|nr:lipoyl synthase [Candidatus Methanoperedens sp.]MCZ7404544.1 lipoyl synthase [Candidatus Methanoperedens sp.]